VPFAQVRLTPGASPVLDTISLSFEEALDPQAVVEVVYEALTLPQTVSIALDFDAKQLATSTAMVQFTGGVAGNWNVPQLVRVWAVDDFVTEGPHNALITHRVIASGTDYDPLNVAPVDVRVMDNDAAGVLITETDGSTDVIEIAPEMELGNGTIAAGSSTTSVNGNFLFSEVGLLDYSTFRFLQMQLADPEGNGDISTVPDSETVHPLTVRPYFSYSTFFQDRNIDGANWTMFSDPNIGDQDDTTAEFIPHVTIEARGDGRFTDSYTFTAEAGSRGIFDVDLTTGGLNTVVILWEVPAGGAVGTILAHNFDSSTAVGGGGSLTSADSYLEYVFTHDGEYRIQVFDTYASVQQHNTVRCHVSTQRFARKSRAARYRIRRRRQQDQVQWRVRATVCRQRCRPADPLRGR
jgi:hypothetical protein